MSRNLHQVVSRELVTVTPAEDLKSITAGRNGEYVPFDFYGVQDGNKLGGTCSMVKWPSALVTPPLFSPRTITLMNSNG